jgi:hypothetical protein
MEVLKETLGEVCLLDKIDRMTYRQQASDILYCWAWMWFPDLLPRAKMITFFDNGSGQAPPSIAGCQRPREVPLHRAARATTSSSTLTSSRTGARLGTARPAMARVGCLHLARLNLKSIR